MNTQLTNNYCI